MDNTSSQAAQSEQDAKGQQDKYQDNDGVGVIKGNISARQGFLDSPVVFVLGVSLTLAFIAFAIVYFFFSSGVNNS